MFVRDALVPGISGLSVAQAYFVADCLKIAWPPPFTPKGTCFVVAAPTSCCNRVTAASPFLLYFSTDPLKSSSKQLRAQPPKP